MPVLAFRQLIYWVTLRDVHYINWFRVKLHYVLSCCEWLHLQTRNRSLNPSVGLDAVSIITHFYISLPFTSLNPGKANLYEKYTMIKMKITQGSAWKPFFFFITIKVSSSLWKMKAQKKHVVCRDWNGTKPHNPHVILSHGRKGQA